MTATDELRRMLDERGMEWSDHSDEFVLHTEWNNYSCWFNEYSDGWTAWGKCVHGTPAEAIEGTLGRETCHDVNEDEHDFTCSECGASMYTQIDDCWTMIARGGLCDDVIERPNYCPNCGAKVVER